MTLSLERRAALWGDRTAVVEDGADESAGGQAGAAPAGERVSYADLNDRAERLARRLAALGVEAGDAVAVVSRNRVEVLALLFAVRRLGAVLAPVSHRLTPATVEGPFETVSPEVVVHEAAQRDLVREVADDRSQEFDDLRRHDGEDYERVDLDPEDPLLYLHATGEADRSAVGEDDEEPQRPGESLNADPTAAERVVAMSERAVEWNCVTAAAAWGLGRDDRAPTLLPFSDADGLLRTALPLLYVGGRVALLRVFDAESALAAVEREGATVCLAGATEYRELVESDAFESATLDSLEWFGAIDPLPVDAREALADEAPVVRVYASVETGANCYVPPESGGAEAGPDFDPDLVGRPFPDCEVRVVADGERVEDGEVGEFEARGRVVASGYLDADGGLREFSGWVSTGDLAVGEDGDYYVLGRAGEAFEDADGRVHPRAVERALASHEDVTAAGAVADADGLRAVVVGDADPGELREYVADRIPSGVEPREIVDVEQLPRRPTGEPDRAKIRREWFADEERIDER
ncbi:MULTISPECIES: class I adenylate-forming enzyme family protein [Halorussus]|uniref:class I adenylate-forming enzyme family protein n=1 Tax=Halorussus TaxID=1070314 RepID=UPI0020A0FD07|nr:class I adenylate-forming enzyme family protein [Halorussus vallis]USZ73933.1 acyl--CoA ligase [Halorussus vallis]